MSSMIGAPKRGKASLLGEAASNALCALLICYSVVSFAAGEIGLLAYRDLSATISTMETKIDQLKADNARLLASKAALSDDGDRIEREARDIGYVRPGEKIVVLPAQLRGPAHEDEVSLQEPLQVGPSTGLPDAFVKLLALSTGFCVFVATLFAGGRSRSDHGERNLRADRS